MTGRSRPRRIIEKFWWDQLADDFAAEIGLDREIVEAAARYPQMQRRDPYSEKVGHTVMNYRRGDIIVTVGFRDPQKPTILHVRLVSNDMHERGGSRTPGGAGATGPTSIRELKRRAVEMGYKVIAGTNHDKIVDPNRGNHVVAVIPRNESKNSRGDRSSSNTWSSLTRYHRARRRDVAGESGPSDDGV